MALPVPCQVRRLPLHIVSLSNQLGEEIPLELGSLVNLEILDLSDNQLSGCVPGRSPGQLDMEYSDLGDLPFCP